MLLRRRFRARKGRSCLLADRQLGLDTLTVQMAGERLQRVVGWLQRLIATDGDFQVDLQGRGVAVVDDEGGAVSEQVLAGRCQVGCRAVAGTVVGGDQDPAVALAGFEEPALDRQRQYPVALLQARSMSSRSGMSVQGFCNEARSSGCLAWAFFSASSARRLCSSRSAACLASSCWWAFHR